MFKTEIVADDPTKARKFSARTKIGSRIRQVSKVFMVRRAMLYERLSGRIFPSRIEIFFPKRKTEGAVSTAAENNLVYLLEEPGGQTRAVSYRLFF